MKTKIDWLVSTNDKMSIIFVFYLTTFNTVEIYVLFTFVHDAAYEYVRYHVKYAGGKRVCPGFKIFPFHI